METECFIRLARGYEKPLRRTMKRKIYKINKNNINKIVGIQQRVIWKMEDFLRWEPVAFIGGYSFLVLAYIILIPCMIINKIYPNFSDKVLKRGGF